MLAQYDPSPPFNSGSPATAGPKAMSEVALTVDPLRKKRVSQVEKIVREKRDD